MRPGKNSKFTFFTIFLGVFSLRGRSRMVLSVESIVLFLVLLQTRQEGYKSNVSEINLFQDTNETVVSARVH
jgi:hypothetical protein